MSIVGGGAIGFAIRVVWTMATLSFWGSRVLTWALYERVLLYLFDGALLFSGRFSLVMQCTVLHLFIWVGLFAGFTGGDPDAMIWGVIVGLINGIGAGIYVANGVDAILEQLRLSQPDREQEEEEINIK